MDGLERRLRALGGGQRPCEECALGGPGPVTFVLGEPLKAGETFEPEYCSRCGEALNLTLSLGSARLTLEDELELLTEEDL